MAFSFIVEKIVSATLSPKTKKTPAPKPKPEQVPKPPEPPAPPKPKPKIFAEWIKAQLEKIANLLLKLGNKALIALPVILGSAINFVLKTTGSVAGYLAENVWVFALAVGGYVMNLYSNESEKKT